MVNRRSVRARYSRRHDTRAEARAISGERERASGRPLVTRLKIVGKCTASIHTDTQRAAVSGMRYLEFWYSFESCAVFRKSTSKRQAHNGTVRGGLEGRRRSWARNNYQGSELWLREWPCRRPSAPTAATSSTGRGSLHIIRLGGLAKRKTMICFFHSHGLACLGTSSAHVRTTTYLCSLHTL